MDKDKKMIEFLQTCPTIQANPLFFNFGEIEDGSNQVIPNSDDKMLQKPFVDGSVAKRYTFNVDSFKSVAYNPIIDSSLDENLGYFEEVQAIADWINEQGDANVFPDFGADCIIEKMETQTVKPALLGVDTKKNPPVAIYRIAIQIDYIDTTKMLWN